MKPAEPEPAKPSKPGEPAKPSKPGEPAKPEEDSAEPAKPVEDSAKPEEDPAKPAAPSEIPDYDESAAPSLDAVLEDSLPPCGPRSEKAYEEGFELLAKGERATAVLRFNEVLASCPEHPYAAEMRRLAAFVISGDASGGVLRRRHVPPPRLAPPETSVEVTAPRREAPTLLARGELITVQTINGFIEGELICGMADCGDARGYVLTGALGVALGGGLSYVLSRDLTPGQVQSINAGTLWGYWDAVAALQIGDPSDHVAGFGMLMLISLGGTGIGAAVAQSSRPDSGSISLASSAGVWSGVLALWAMRFAGVPLFDRTFFGVELIATNGALAIGGFASRYFHASRGHLLLIDAGGIVGMLAGVGAALLIDPEPSGELIGGLGFLGTAGGLATVAYLSRHIDDAKSEGPQLSVVPLSIPKAKGLALALSF